MAEEMGHITDKRVKSLKPKPGFAVYDFMDTVLPGFGVRVSESGRRTFMLVARFPGIASRSASRRALGPYPKVTLEGARAKARKWLDLIEQGVDPAEREKAEQAAAQQRRANSFAAIAEDFIREKLPTERKGREVERDIRRELLPALGKRPITDITKKDVLAIINAKKGAAPAQARNLLGVAKRLFTWAVDQSVYDLDASPIDGLKPTKIIGEKVHGERVLSDDELRALWACTLEMPYPYGPVYQLLVRTALRLNEVADASWPEFDFREALWTIPALRMKGRAGKARPHAVPLTKEVLEIIESLPRFKTGKFLFSTTFGLKPTWMSDKIKKDLDKRMLVKLRAFASARGEDAAGLELPPWTNHDIRRTVRSHLSALRISEEAREAVLAHARPGIAKTYDRYAYREEKRDALEQWAARLRSTVEPAPANVVTLRANA